MSDAARLLEAMRARAGGRQRIDIDTVWAAFLESIRGYTGAAEARPHLAALLTGLASDGRVQVPRGKRLWDRSATPPLPAWVQLPGSAVDNVHRPDHRAIAWPPELAFVARMESVRALDELLSIKRFLGDGGRQRRLVPARERSLELFGDEKRLDALATTAMFRDGRLSLDLLRCYPVAPPLVWEGSTSAGDGRAIVVLENLHTYDSFRRWNRSSGVYAAIAYGHGSEFRGTCRDLPRLCAELDTTLVHYFGDLDVEGLLIPVHAQRVLHELDVPIDLLPATRWYAALLEMSSRAVPTASRPAVSDEALAWLPAALRSAARVILDAGTRLPQELVGTDVLASQ